MIKRALIFGLFLTSTVTFAQEPNKCKVGGAWVYQDSPCKVIATAKPSTPVSTTSSAAPVPAATPSAPTAAQSELERQKAFLAKGAKDRKISDLKFEIEQAELGITNLRKKMTDELARLENQKYGTNNNLAGAVYLNSLATERQAVTSRYEIDINAQRDKLKQLRDELVAAQKS